MNRKVEVALTGNPDGTGTAQVRNEKGEVMESWPVSQKQVFTISQLEEASKSIMLAIMRMPEADFNDALDVAQQINASIPADTKSTLLGEVMFAVVGLIATRAAMMAEAEAFAQRKGIVFPPNSTDFAKDG